MPNRFLWHFLPLALSIVYLLSVLDAHTDADITLLFQERSFARRPLLFNTFVVLDLGVMPLYAVLSWRLLGRHQRQIAERYSYRKSVDYRWLRRLVHLLAHMEADRPYLGSSMNIRDLADAMGLSEHNVSEVINAGLGKSFYDFVNGYRVEEFKRRLQNEGSAHLTLLALALDSGFNSKSSFNRIFKQHTGLTPSAYRKSLTGDPSTQ